MKLKLRVAVAGVSLLVSSVAAVCAVSSHASPRALAADVDRSSLGARYVRAVVARARSVIGRMEADLEILRVTLFPVSREPVKGGGLLALEMSLSAIASAVERVGAAVREWRLDAVLSGRGPVSTRAQKVYKLSRAYSVLEDPASSMPLRAAAYRELCEQGVYINGTNRALWVADVERAIGDDTTLLSLCRSTPFIVVDEAVVSVMVAASSTKSSATRYQMVSELGRFARRECEALKTNVLSQLLTEMTHLDDSAEVRRKAAKELERIPNR